MRNLILAMLLVPSLAWGADPILPNPAMTPGDTLPVGLDKVCTVGYTKTVRHVSQSKKDHIYELYGITRVPGQYEVDHLISLELGGSNSMRNLWPQSFYTETWNARVKDGLEHHLNRMVCDGKISLEEAQKAIATDWIAAYCKYDNKLPASCATYMEKVK
jgi:hypothetical protein